jgi:predicted small lipoprotein YifL
MVPPSSGAPFVSHSRDQTFARFAILAALAAALVLTACGRKGPLDPPPGAAASAAGANGAPAAGATPEQAGEVAYGPDGQPLAPRGPRKRIFLDWLLD